jgi:hypothetical protein
VQKKDPLSKKENVVSIFPNDLPNGHHKLQTKRKLYFFINNSIDLSTIRTKSFLKAKESVENNVESNSD